MGTISKADFETVSDVIAAEFALYETYISGAGGAHEFAEDNEATVLGLGDFDQVNDLLSAAEAAVRQLANTGMSVDGFRPLIKALNVHVDGIQAFCVAQSILLAPEFKTIADIILGIDLTKAVVFSPAIADMGTFDPDGAGAGTFTDGSAVDNTLYGDAPLVAEITAVGGAGPTLAANLSVDITLTVDGGGGPFVETVDFTTADVLGSQVVIGTPPAKFSDVTGMAISGSNNGTSGDQVTVKATRERALPTT